MMGGIYQGWRVLAGGFTCALLTVGSTIYLFGLLVVPVSKEFDFSRSQVNLGMIALMIGVAIWSPVVGRLIDRTPSTVIFSLGALALATGTGMVALSKSPWVLLAATLLVVAFGIAACGPLATNAVASRWFRRRRGRALGMLAVSAAAGGVVVPPLAAVLIEAYGWRTAVVVIGACVSAIIMLVNLLVIRDRPSPQELSVAGEIANKLATAAPDQAATDENRQWSIKEILGLREFWLVLIGSALLSGSDQTLVAILVPFYQEQGLSLREASTLLAMQSASAAVGMILIGFLAERFHAKHIFIIIAVLHAVLILCLIYWPGYWIMMAALSVIGLAIGGALTIKVMLINIVFGSGSFGFVMGMMSLALNTTSMLFLAISGVVYDTWGNYIPAFWVLLCSVIIATIAVQFIRTNN